MTYDTNSENTITIYKGDGSYYQIHKDKAIQDGYELQEEDKEKGIFIRKRTENTT